VAESVDLSQPTMITSDSSSDASSSSSSSDSDSDAAHSDCSCSSCQQTCHADRLLELQLVMINKILMVTFSKISD